VSGSIAEQASPLVVRQPLTTLGNTEGRAIGLCLEEGLQTDTVNALRMRNAYFQPSTRLVSEPYGRVPARSEAYSAIYSV
jgi:hypothetical protein